jgi:modulator of FtsH protease HflK
MVDNPDNPWEKPKKPSSDPWQARTERKRKPSGGDIPPIFSQFKNRVNPGDNPAKLIVLVVVVLAALWVASGLYRVLPEENAVILRFGKFIDTQTNPGLHYHLPWPVETVEKPNVTFERRVELGYRGAFYEGSAKQDIPEESLILTGDANIVDLDFVVQWKVSNAKEFLFNIRDPEMTLKRVAESAMREVIGQNRMQDIITDRREDIGARVKKSMQTILDNYGAGVLVTQVLIQEASVPSPVLDAFEDVIRATQQSETMKNQALRYRNEIVPRAQGEAIRVAKESEGYKERVIAGAKGDAERFNNVYDAYAGSKDVTRKRLYLDMWQEVLRGSDAIVLDNKGGGGTVPYINLNELRNSKKAATTAVEENMQ